ncbi:alpha/beta hydrolase [Flavobacterium salilacus subsp. salilacus]|uniref:alpha/beta hydrolase n=1 Tax=Flavobacterium TaxID=237 RepID=UPI001075499F|nr:MULTISPECIES: alpha/beta hydrolase-fold protein [Flavobacterium]KAF2518713.1 alpha/beta hydrolase [Flavobacterium salilacus subsp. salilacus]MBE1613678.1 alpha/beta hydrolase [Flavobacterium sp. SaA2.13]
MKRLLFLFCLLFINRDAIAQSTASENVSTVTIHAPQLNSDRKLFIYLPHNYKKSTKKYPVIYMHDAQNLFDKQTAYSGEWRVDEILDSLKAQVIVVGISHGEAKRIDELTPYSNPEYGGGGADAYLDFVVKTVKPYIDTTYRTQKNKKHTYIFGSSLGGLVSYYALLKYPKVFGGAGVFSPSFWFTDAIYTLTEETPEINSRIYFMAGESESETMIAELRKMEKLIRNKIKNENSIKVKTVPEGKHNEALWGKEFTAAYLWLIGKR